MSLIGQSWELMSELAKRTPWGRIRIQPLIEDIGQVSMEFVAFLENGGRVYPRQGPVFDFDVEPYIPDGWEIRPEDQITSRLTGSWQLDVTKVGLYSSERQQGQKTVRGVDLLCELEGKRVLPAHVIEELLKYPVMIPDSWKHRNVYFWGTVYRDASGCRQIRILSWTGAQGWHWSSHYLERDDGTRVMQGLWTSQGYAVHVVD